MREEGSNTDGDLDRNGRLLKYPSAIGGNYNRTLGVNFLSWNPHLL
jgi:hypothetical protein